MKKKIRLVLILLALFYLGLFGVIIYSAFALQKGIDSLPASVHDNDWKKTATLIDGGRQSLKNIKVALILFFPINKLPLLKGEVQNLYSILDSGALLFEIGEDFTNSAAENKALSQINILDFPSLPAKDKEIVLRALADSADSWQKHRQEIEEIEQKFINSSGQSRLPFVRKKINDARIVLSSALALVSDFEPWIKNIPDILGYPEEKAYLLLLQNNTELRPTGGFIGTFGVLKAAAGEISEFYTENVYNLDEPAKKFNSKVPPPPLQKYIKQSQWFFRDSNWDPDFPATAQTAIQFYHDEKGREGHFDGVIAFTPELIKEFLRITGPIEIEGNLFSADNIVEKLQYEVARGFAEQGVSIYNRKRIIDSLAQALKQRINNLSFSQARALLPQILRLMQQKHLLLNFNNVETQKLVEEKNWAGAIIQTSFDYFYVVDANLGSLKTDPAVEHLVDYQITAGADGQLSNKLYLTYKNAGEFDWKTTRYRTYVRVYLPLGSKLLAAAGNEEKVTQTEEHGKTIFGTFISIEPGKEETLAFNYQLPLALQEKIKQNNYELYVQKQPGTIAHRLSLNIELPYQVVSVQPKEIFRIKDDRVITGDWDLAVDREIRANPVRVK